MKIKGLQVGITGGIGAGKSVVCRIFNALGAPVYDADSRAKHLMRDNVDLHTQIVDKFGEDSYTSQGELNREYLASQVFGDSKKVALLNALVHPVVRTDYQQWAQRQDGPYLVREAALLIESGAYLDLNYLISVRAPVELRISRVLQRDPHRSREQVLGIISNQLTDEMREEKSHFVIDNDEEHMLIPQVLELHKQFIG